MDYIKYKLFLFLILFSTSAVSLEVTVYIPIYEPLSKTISTPIAGSSNIIIDQKDFTATIFFLRTRACHFFPCLRIYAIYSFPSETYVRQTHSTRNY